LGSFLNNAIGTSDIHIPATHIIWALITPNSTLPWLNIPVFNVLRVNGRVGARNGLSTAFAEGLGGGCGRSLGVRREGYRCRSTSPPPGRVKMDPR
jgi:hypothetical protein